MDDFSFWQTLFFAIRPGEHTLHRGEDLRSSKLYFHRTLDKMENKYPDIPDELITKLRKEFDEGIAAAEEGFFVAGIQFGVCLMHVALG